jgi:hypothetical protein
MTDKELKDMFEDLLQANEDAIVDVDNSSNGGKDEIQLHLEEISTRYQDVLRLL